MPTAEKALVQVEQSATLKDFELMLDSGDHQHFTSSEDIYSALAGSLAEARPNGIDTGYDLLSPHASDDTIAFAAFTAYAKGVKLAVAAGSLVVTRGVAAKAKIISIVCDDTGTVTEVLGTDSADTSFDEGRGVAGSAPYIPLDSIELGQLRIIGDVAAVFTASEILQVPGQHSERSASPQAKPNTIGLGLSAKISAETFAHVKTAAALPLIHTGDVAKRIYLKSYAPVFGDVGVGSDFKAAEIAHSISSQQFYNTTVGSRSSSLGTGGFTALLDDGITDPLVTGKDEVRTVRFYPDRNKLPFLLTQGAVGIDREWPHDGQIAVKVVLAAETASAGFSG